MSGRVYPDSAFKNTRAGEAAVENMDRYWKYGGEPCGYVPSLILHPGHRDLEWRRLRYFLYWRTCVYSGIYGDTDAGYVWLHAMELLLVDDDPDEADRCLKGMMEAYGGQNKTVDRVLKDACVYNQALNRMDISDFPELDRNYRILRICMILSSYRFVPLSANDMAFLTGHKGERIRIYADKAAVIVSAALHEIGRWQKPAGILALCPRPFVASLKFPFAEDFQYSFRTVTVSCRDVKGSEQFSKLAKNLHEACLKYLAGKKDALDSAGTYSETLRKCAEAYEKGDLDGITVPYRKTGSPWNETMYSHYRWFIEHRRDGTWPSYRFQSRMRDYSGVRVPSAGRVETEPYEKPCYSRMTLGEYGEYQAWKEAVLKGEDARSERGFSWLLSQEILCDQDLDPESVLEALALCKKNSEPYMSKRIDNAMLDWCLLKGLEPRHMDQHSDIIRAEALTARALTSEPPGDLVPEQIRRCWNGNQVDGMTARAVNASLKAIHANGTRLSSIADLRTRTQVIPTFEEFAGMPISIDAEVFGTGNSDYCRIISSVCKVAKEVLDGNGNPRCPAGFGAGNRNIVRDTVLGIIKEEEDRKRREYAANIRLDMSAVKAAAEDLSAVTEMLRTGEEDRAEEKSKTIVPQENKTIVIESKTIPNRSGDPWKDFASMLTEGQKEYVRKCLEGTRADRSAEKAVNSAAMDTIGDVVLENGTAIEDYAEMLAKTVS